MGKLCLNSSFILSLMIMGEFFFCKEDLSNNRSSLYWVTGILDCAWWFQAEQWPNCAASKQCECHQPLDLSTQCEAPTSHPAQPCPGIFYLPAMGTGSMTTLSPQSLVCWWRCHPAWWPMVRPQGLLLSPHTLWLWALGSALDLHLLPCVRK